MKDNERMKEINEKYNMGTEMRKNDKLCESKE